MHIGDLLLGSHQDVCVLKISWYLFLHVFQMHFQGSCDTQYSHCITGNRKLTVLQKTACSKIFTEGYKVENVDNVPRFKHASLYCQSKELGFFNGLQ